MLLASLLRRMTPVALSLVVSCGTTPLPDNIQGTADFGLIRGTDYYPQALVEEFRKFNYEIEQPKGQQTNTAVLARIEWNIGTVNPGCDLVIAIRHTPTWYNYALAGDGNPANAITNWWGRAQEKHRELRDPLVGDDPLRPNPPYILDVFSISDPPANGQALSAWYVREGEFFHTDMDSVRGYLVYGCEHSRQFTVTPIEIFPIDKIPIE